MCGASAFLGLATWAGVKVPKTPGKKKMKNAFYMSLVISQVIYIFMYYVDMLLVYLVTLLVTYKLFSRIYIFPRDTRDNKI